MANRFIEAWDSHRSAGRKGLIPFIVGGWPEPGSTAPLLRMLQESGALAVEIGFPFSDPIADGPTIAAAMHDAIARGATPRLLFDQVRQARAAGLTVPLVAMVSVSIVERLGPARFINDAAESGFDGLIVPDLPLEECGEIAELAASRHMTFTHLIAPTSPPDRIAALARASTGFVYLLARVGITGGTAAEFNTESVRAAVEAVRRATTIPVACGFGISTAAHARAAVRDAGSDGAIVGSGLVSAIAKAHLTKSDCIAAARQYIEGMRSGIA